MRGRDRLLHPADEGGRGYAETRKADTSTTNAPRPGDTASSASGNIEMVMRIPVNVQAILGTAVMPVAQLLKLGRGSIVSLNRRVGEPVDIVVNGQTIARGEVVVIDEDGSRFGVSLTEVLSRESKQSAFGDRD